MARKRDPRRDEALKIFIERNGEISNRKLASLLDVPEKTISAWKSRDKWNEVLRNDNCSTSNDECSTTKKVGAPPGNQNAKGNKGNSRASPPIGNKNAVKTGEHETIFFDMLSEDERNIYSTMSDDPFFVLSEEIKILKIRQRRMMKRISDAEKGLNQKEQQILYELRDRREVVEGKGKQVEISIPELQMTEMKEKTFRKINDILSIEEALTRISNQLTRSVKQLQEALLYENRNELMNQQIGKLKAEIEELKGSSAGNEDATDWKTAVLEAANRRVNSYE
ncbi:small subunit of terminase [Enterococcus sp. BWB1-3]|uniref:phage terminase small subunit n=1 Tax=Enterococcus sp. BWB1-3 TaxID=2787713 RepID=UPI0019230B36|nr:phage terminase small subunit [Enterococcus sp. BWB1-3]MBL1228149.1 small subunit of terminase [Enterococcus sp. BWB1-3]